MPASSAKLAELVALSVVEDVDVELVGGPVDVHRGERGVFHDAKGLVVGRNEEIDCGPLGWVVGRGTGVRRRGQSVWR